MIMERKMKNVVLYARESNHTGANDSLKRQKERLEAFCEQQGYAVSDVIATTGSRQDSLFALKQAIECAKNTEGKTLLMQSANRVVGTVSEMETVVNLIKASGVSVVTMDGSYENMNMYGALPEMFIEKTLASLYNEFDEETD